MSCLHFSDLAWRQHLTVYERPKSTGGCQQAVDQTHIGIKLHLAGAGVGISKANGNAVTHSGISDIADNAGRGQADGLLGHLGGDTNHARQCRIGVYKFIYRVRRAAVAEDIPPSTQVAGQAEVDKTIARVKK
jgi:hypothetical protein